MRDGIGSTVMIVLILAFIVIVSSYLAYNVNYTKAFRMKNKIISTYEDYHGICEPTKCEKEIEDYAKELGYRPANIICPTGYDSKPAGKNLYCVKEVTINSSASSVDEKKPNKYYKIITRINIEIPLFDNIFNFGVFNITGDTKLVYNS